MEDEQGSKVQKQNVGNAGEYYIAARLSVLNFVTTITLGRAEKYDKLALSPNRLRKKCLLLEDRGCA